jgi:uncharacterized membrane protein/thiol-disulfide isomerase/thioredoxin
MVQHTEQAVKLLRSLFVLCILLGFVSAGVGHAQTPESAPVVRAILFYSPECPHCEYVIQEVLPPLFQEYGKQLQIIGFDVNHPQGQALFRSAIDYFGAENAGVPFLVIDDIYIIGSNDIPAQLPNLVDTYLKLGGVDWPAVPGLRETLDASAAASTSGPPTAQRTAIADAAAPDAASGIENVPGVQSPTLTWRDRFQADLPGNSLAVVVLAALLVSAVFAVWLLSRQQPFVVGQKLAWTIPWLCLIGAAVAGYLTYVEMTQTAAVCGPVGDCNTVQSSAYARLFGILPIGLLGILVYLAIGVAWIVRRSYNGLVGRWGALGLFLASFTATLFSIYLTFLEPFVIGATCAWCLLSALLMAILALLAVEPARLALFPPRAADVARRRGSARTRARQSR